MLALQTDEDKHILGGPGLLVVDRHVEEVAASSYYLVEADGKLDLVNGSGVSDASPALALVLCCSRPPRAKYDPASETSELINI